MDVRYLLMFCASRNRNSSIREKVTFVGEREGENESGNAYVKYAREGDKRLAKRSDRGTNRVEINHYLYI